MSEVVSYNGLSCIVEVELITLVAMAEFFLFLAMAIVRDTMQRIAIRRANPPTTAMLAIVIVFKPGVLVLGTGMHISIDPA